jgi:hypothetical protein
VGWADPYTKRLAERGRFTRTGRAVAGGAAVLAEPFDWLARRHAAARYNRRYPSTQMPAADGYTLLAPGSLPGTHEIVETCRRLYESKQQLLAEMQGAKGKRSFLRNTLSDDDLRAHPALVDFALSDPLLSIVTNYLKVIPRLNRLDLVHSIPRPGAQQQLIASQLFHQDHEGLRQAKLFLNIFDVGEEHGPFTFIPADQSDAVLRAIRQQRAAAGVEHHGHYSDQEIEAQSSGAAAIRVTGPAGSSVLVDTSRCLHAGSRVQPGHFRLVLYIQYCTTNEKGNTFDAARFRNDAVRWLALRRQAAPV